MTPATTPGVGTAASYLHLRRELPVRLASWPLTMVVESQGSTTGDIWFFWFCTFPPDLPSLNDRTLQSFPVHYLIWWAWLPRGEIVPLLKIALLTGRGSLIGSEFLFGEAAGCMRRSPGSGSRRDLVSKPGLTASHLSVLGQVTSLLWIPVPHL